MTSEMKLDELKRAEEFFAEQTRLKLPFRDTQRDKKSAAVRWWLPLRRMFRYADNDLELTLRLIEAACNEHKDRALHISAPASIENVFIDIYRRQESGESGVW